MEKKSEVTPSNEKPEAARGAGMNRREMVRRLATVMTAGTAMAAAPAVAAAHPASKRAMGDSAMPQGDAKAADKAWSPLFFDPHQNETFVALAERIVPGSTGAQVNRFVDLLLSVDSLEARKGFLNSLSAFDAYSLATYHRPFKDVTEDEQNQTLTLASTAKSGSPNHGFRRQHILGPSHQQTEGEQHLTLRDHFENVKHWVGGAYFSSEPGMKSLGWTGQVIWPSFPGCQHSEGHA